MLKKIGKSLRDQAKGAIKEAKLIARSHTDPRFGREELAQGFRGLGLVPGDAVFVHSSLKSLGYVEGGPIAVFEALWDAIGPDGTMIVPTYYLPGGTIANAAKDPEYIFDPTVHGSNLGALPSAFLSFPGVRRSLHPTHSVSAVGRHAEFVTAGHHKAASVFGEGSPWQRFIELGGKLLGVGISMGPVTFYHRLEDEMGDAFPLPVKRPETNRMRCRDATGVVHEVPVRAFEVEYMHRRIDNSRAQGRPRLLLARVLECRTDAHRSGGCGALLVDRCAGLSCPPASARRRGHHHLREPGGHGSAWVAAFAGGQSTAGVTRPMSGRQGRFQSTRRLLIVRPRRREQPSSIHGLMPEPSLARLAARFCGSIAV